jgi:hypothetical protein
LTFLENPFSTQEIDDNIKALPNNKSPGSEGFNNEFLKASWQTIKYDFYNLCEAFHSNSICLKSINNIDLSLLSSARLRALSPSLTYF